MTAPDSLPLHAVTEDLASASPDLLRTMITTFANSLMSAEADALCGAEYRQVSDERVNSRNGYRSREWDTRAGTVELAIPKLRKGSYFPSWLLERRRRADQAHPLGPGSGHQFLHQLPAQPGTLVLSLRTSHGLLNGRLCGPGYSGHA